MGRHERRRGGIPAGKTMRRRGGGRSQGAAMLYLIALLAIFGAVGAGIAILSPTASMTELVQNREQRAFYLAQSGINAWQIGNTGTFTLGSDTFTLTQTGPTLYGYAPKYDVISVGTANPGTSLEANYRLARTGANGLTRNDIISFDRNMGDFTTPGVGATQNKANAVTVFDTNQPGTPSGYNATAWAADYAANVGQYSGTWMRFADDLNDSNGVIWYRGNFGGCTATPCAAGTCKGGQCGLGNGLRAVFSFKFAHQDTSNDSKAYADVMTFAIMNAVNNNPATAAGGPAPGDPSLGEYLGYAGLGPSRAGIKPPKMAVEVDTYPNACNSVYDHGTPQSDSRCDYDNNNHIAVVFWGDSGSGDPDFADDNRHGHGAGGSGDDPWNPTYDSTCRISDKDCGYYKSGKVGSSQWLEDGNEHTMRVEIVRADVTSHGSVTGGTYEIKAWVDDQVSGHEVEFFDVTTDYTRSNPKIDYMVTLSSTYHSNLAQIYFGWTEGTGGSSQTAYIHDFFLDFRP